MTCIVGINTGKKIIIAGDNMGSNGHTYGQDKKPKVFKREDFIFGVCGCYRVMQLLHHEFNIPKRLVGQTTDNYIYTTFVKSVFNLFDANNALTLKDGQKVFSGAFLFGYESELYKMYNNFQINVDVKNYDATGPGCHHAVASLYSTHGLNISAEERLKRAIDCANEFVISVDNKMDLVEIIYKSESPLNKNLTKKKTRQELSNLGGKN